MVFGFKKIASVILLGSAMLISCSDKGNENTPPEIIVPEVVPKAVVMPTGREISTDYFLKGRISDPMKVYTVDMLIKSNLSTEFAFTDTSPSMPFVLNVLSAVQLEKAYKFAIGENKSSTIGGAPLEWTRLTFSGDGTTIRFFINGELAATEEDAKPLSGRILLGKGYKNRGWVGKISYFDIYSSSVLPSSFSATSSRLTGGRLYSIEDLSPPE